MKCKLNKKSLYDCDKCIYFIRKKCRGPIIKGFATRDDTKKFLYNGKVHKSNIRELCDFFVSSIGFGSNKPTYPRFKEEYKIPFKESLRAFIENKGNIIDVALDSIYMGGWSEYILGDVLREMILEGKAKREQIAVISKSPSLYENFDFCIQNSLDNLNLETIDIYLVHDHEVLFTKFDSQKAKTITRNIISSLENNISKNKIRYYGISIGDHHLVSKNSLYPNLEEIYSIAEDIGGKKNGFKVIEIPLNPTRPEAIFNRDQVVKGKILNIIEAAKEFKLDVIITESLSRGSPLGNYDDVPGNNIFQRQLVLLKSLNDIKTILFGSINPDHVKNNMEILKIPNLDQKIAEKTFYKMSESIKNEWWIHKVNG